MFGKKKVEVKEVNWLKFANRSKTPLPNSAVMHAKVFTHILSKAQA